MKLLTATGLTQGYRDNDFHFCVEGELVHIDLPCAMDRGDADGACGCGCSFGGLNSHHATTTAMIRDVEGFGPGDYLEALRSSLEQQGYDSSQAVHEAAALALPGPVLAGRYRPRAPPGPGDLSRHLPRTQPLAFTWEGVPMPL